MRLSFDTIGPSDGEPTVLLHGWTSSRNRYPSSVAEMLGSRGLRVFNVDLRGHGESPWSDSYRATDYAADVADLVEAERLNSVVVVAHSMGGLVASVMAARRPDLVRALFLEDPALFEPTHTEAERADIDYFSAQVRGWQSADLAVADVVEVIRHWPSSDPERTMGDEIDAGVLATYASNWLRMDPAVIDAFMSGDTFDGPSPAVLETCPVTILRADPELDAVFLPEHADRYTAAVPHARVTLAAGSSHSILPDPAGRDRYISALDGFLDSL